MDEIKILIEAFYNGETSVEQEKALLTYFESQDVAEELLGEKELFLQMTHNTEPVTIPSGLESRLGSLIDALDKEEKQKKESQRRVLWMRITSVACIAILFSIGIYFNHEPTPIAIVQTEDVYKDTFTDPDQAQVEAEKALLLLSSKFNKGVEQMAQVSNGIDKTNEIIEKSLNRKKEKES